MTQISNDSWITTKVKSALLTNEKLNGVKVKVITEDSDVFLFGYVTPEQADVATDDYTQHFRRKASNQSIQIW